MKINKEFEKYSLSEGISSINLDYYKKQLKNYKIPINQKNKKVGLKVRIIT